MAELYRVKFYRKEKWGEKVGVRILNFDKFKQKDASAYFPPPGAAPEAKALVFNGGICSP